MQEETTRASSRTRFRKLYFGVALATLMGALLSTAAPVFAETQECTRSCQNFNVNRGIDEARDGVLIIDRLDDSMTWFIAQNLSGKSPNEIVLLALEMGDPSKGKSVFKRIKSLRGKYIIQEDWDPKDHHEWRDRNTVLEILHDRVQQRVERLSNDMQHSFSPSLKSTLHWITESRPNVDERLNWRLPATNEFVVAKAGDESQPSVLVMSFNDQLRRASSNEKLKEFFRAKLGVGAVQRSVIEGLDSVEMNLLRDHFLADRRAEHSSGDRQEFWRIGSHLADQKCAEKAINMINSGKQLYMVIDYLFGEAEGRFAFSRTSKDDKEVLQAVLRVLRERTEKKFVLKAVDSSATVFPKDAHLEPVADNHGPGSMSKLPVEPGCCPHSNPPSNPVGRQPRVVKKPVPGRPITPRRPMIPRH